MVKGWKNSQCVTSARSQSNGPAAAAEVMHILARLCLMKLLLLPLLRSCYLSLSLNICLSRRLTLEMMSAGFEWLVWVHSHEVYEPG